MVRLTSMASTAHTAPEPASAPAPTLISIGPDFSPPITSPNNCEPTGAVTSTPTMPNGRLMSIVTTVSIGAGALAPRFPSRMNRT